MAGAAVIPSAPQHRHESDRPDLVERTIADGFPWMTFPRELEERFLREGEAKRFLIMVVAGLSAVLLFGGMLIADFLMARDQLHDALLVRMAIFPPIIVAGMVVLRKLRIPALNEWGVTGAGLLASLLQSWIMLHGTHSWSVARVVELNIILVYTCAIARFWPGMMAASLIMCIHGYVVTHMPDGTGVLAFNTTLLTVTATAFVLYGTYKQEHDERMAFLLDAREQLLNAELTEAHERLTRMATTDALTGVANRRYFEDFINECWGRAREQRRSLSFIIMDVDFFKPFNDRYGHQAGDRCLIAVAQALKTCIRRPGDLVARWGGEEFVIVMMDADADAASAAAERIREAVAGLGLVHEASRCAPHVTISGGRATIRPGAHDEWGDLVQQADDALYRAKTGGRNRVYAGYVQPACLAS